MVDEGGKLSAIIAVEGSDAGFGGVSLDAQVIQVAEMATDKRSLEVMVPRRPLSLGT